MSLLAVGSVALDSIQTPDERRDDVLGGSATFFSYAASFFAPVRLVGVIGSDFPQEHVRLLEEHGVDTAGLDVVKGGRTFRWTGRYHEDLNTRETLHLELNVFGDHHPKVPEKFRDSRFVFLANGSPKDQMHTLAQVKSPDFVMCDTMNYWIDTEPDALHELLPKVDALVINDEEARMLGRKKNLIEAGRSVLRLGPKIVIVKKGEHGAFLFSSYFSCALPAFPVARVVDPTGAGDVFAGGFMGYLAEGDQVTLGRMRRAMGYGTVLASFGVERFSLDGLRAVTRQQVDRRFDEFRDFVGL